MASLYNRTAQITIGDLEFSSDRYDPSGALARGFRMAFKVKQTLDGNANTAEASIWGLGDDSRSRIINAAKPSGGVGPLIPAQFLIEAGYGLFPGTLFKGTFELATSEKEPTSFVVKVSATDGLTQGAKVVNDVLAPGATLEQAIRAIARRMEVSAEKAVAQLKQHKPGEALKTFTKGLSIFGPAKTELDRLAKTYAFEYAVVDGELQITTPGAPTADEAILLSKETGLIEAPQRVADKGLKKVIIKAKSLLQAGLRPGRPVQLVSRDFSGAFKVVNVEHEGETHGQNWYSTCEMTEIQVL